MKKLNRRLSLLALSTALVLPAVSPVLAMEPESLTETQPEAAVSGTCTMNGEIYPDIQSAINSAADGAVIEIIKDETIPVTIPAGKTITIRVAQGVRWSNADAAGDHWINSVIHNYGNLTVISNGTIAPAAHKSQTMAIYNRPGATAVLKSGLYTSDHGDYVIWNQGDMVLSDGLTVQKPIAGSHSAIINGWRNNAEIDGPQAKMTIVNASVDATATGGIALKNDDNAFMEIQNGSFRAWTTALQNSNEAVISGGTFTTVRPNSFSVYNFYGNDTYNKGILTITGGDFFADAENVTAIRNAAGDNGKIEISGGTYFADQDCVKDYIVEPYVLRPIGERFEVIIPVIEITLDPSNHKVFEQDLVTINGFVRHENAKYPNITWSVSDPNLLELSAEAGQAAGPQTITVKALKAGQADIIAQADGVEARATINIEKASATLTLDPSSATLKEEETLQIKPVITPETAVGSKIEWISSDLAIVSVDENGLVKALKAGKAAITAKIDGAEASCKITVEAKKSSASEEDKKDPSKGDDDKTSTDQDKKKPSASDKKADTGVNTMTGLALGALILSAIVLLVLKRKKSQ